jgi:hypothetical protein
MYFLQLTCVRESCGGGGGVSVGEGVVLCW